MGMKRVQQQDSLQENQQNKNQIPQQTSSTSTSTSTNTIIIRGQKNNEKDESKFSRVKRVLTGSLLLGRGNRENIKRFFGVNIEDIESYNDTGIPYVVYRLCNYIENNAFNNPTLFRLSGGNPRLTEKLRNSFERRGDADLEGAACPSTAATLLRQYFKELPQPLVPSSMVARLVNIHSQEFENNHEAWIQLTNQLLQSLPTCHYKLLSYLIIYLSKYESRHGRECGVCGVFAPVVLPHVPPATTLLRDILNETSRLFKTSNSIFRDSSDNSSPIIITKDNKDILFALKPRKRKDNNCENCCQENKLIRSNSEERILVNSTKESNKSIRRVSSHEDFKTYRRLHILQSIIGQEMGHGVRCGGLPLHERSTNISPVSSSSSSPPVPAAAATQSALSSPCHQITTTERQEFDVENLRCTERFSRSIIPRGRRQARRRKIKLCQNYNNNNNDDDCDQSKENDNNNKTDGSFYFESSSKNNQSTTTAAATGQSFLEMLNSGPSRSPSPARALARASDENPNDPEITNWHYQHLTNENLNIINNEEKNNENSTYHINATLSPRNSQLLSTRRFFNDENDNYEDDDDSELFNLTTIPPIPLLPPQPPPQIIKKITTTTTTTDIELKNLTKKINGLKKKIKKYEEQFEEMNGYRPSHSDKMNNRDIKKLLVELNKLRKEHKLLKEDSINTNIFHNNNNNNNNNKINKIDNLSLQCKLKNNNNCSEKSNALLMEEMVKDMEKKLTDKRIKLNRNINIEEYNYDELLDEKTSLQKALLQIESIFGRAVSKEDRIVVRPLYDRYRTLKRLLIRASSSKHKDSISELATILEHEAMDFTSSSSSSLVITGGGGGGNDENKQQQDTLNNCIDSSSSSSSLLFTTDSDSQHSSSEESRGIAAAVVVTSGTSEILHSMPYDDLIAQKIIIREEKKRLRRSLKELEMEFELKTGRKMQKDDRKDKQIQIIYESYKQTKGKLRLIEALIAKNA